MILKILLTILFYKNLRVKINHVRSIIWKEVLIENRIIRFIKKRDEKALDCIIDLYSDKVFYIVNQILRGYGGKEDIEIESNFKSDDVEKEFMKNVALVA